MPKSRRDGDRSRVVLAAALLLSAVMAAPAYAADAWTAQPAWDGPTMSAGNAKPTLGDLNGDGLLDLMVGDKNGVVHAYVNTGSASAPVWTANTAWDVNTGGTYAAPRLGDIDGDGKLDLMVGGGSNMRAYRNTGTTSAPVWTRTTAWDLTGLLSSKRYVPSLADLDNDGLIDMVVGQLDGSLTAYRNTGSPGSPVWTVQPAWSPSPLFDSSRYSSPVMAKLDAGGTYDMLYGDQLGTVFALQNIGTATSPQWNAIGEWFVADPNSSADDYASPAVGDLNGDGQPDVLYGDVSGTVTAYKNNGLPPPGPGTGPAQLPPDLTTAHERFDGFACSGAWQPAASGPNSSYSRDCGNGWTAYAQDVSNAALSSPTAGPIGNQNVVTADSVNGPSDTASPASAAELYTAPSDSVRGVLWLLKTYAVQPGRIIDTLTADFRDKISAASDTYVGIVVFDGTVTDPSGQTVSGVPQRSDVLASDVVREGGSSCGANVWCGWQTAAIGGHIIPTKSTITVGLRIEDVGTTYTAYAEFDNLTISGVATPAVSSVPVGDIAQLWTTSYTASGDHNMAHPADVAVDAASNVYVVGSAYNGLNYDILTIKYDSSGNQLWQATYDGGDSDEGVGVSVDGSGNVYVSGRSWNGSNNDFVVVKYNSGGNQQWATPVDGGADDIPVGQALDASGNLYVTGSSCLVNSCDYLTAKVTSIGNVAWSQVYNGGTYDNAAGIVLDSAGNAYVTGTSTGPSSDDIVTIKYTSSGSQAWLDRFDSGTNDHAMAIAAGAGHVYAAGWDFKSGTPDIALISFDPSTGAEQWVKTYDSGAQDLPTALAVDGSGNVYLTGTIGTVGDHRIVTAMYQPDGANAWLHTYGQSGYDNSAVRIAVDGSGNVYIAGTVERSSGNTDFVTLRYDSSGTARNAITYDGYTVGDTGVAIALGVDAQGDTVPVVTGTSTDTQGVQHIALVRYEKAQPDLIMTSLAGPSSLTAGDTITVSDTVANLSDLANKIYASTQQFDVVYYLAPDIGGVPDLGNMSEIGYRTVANLDPGQSSSGSPSITVPTSVTEGQYFLVAVADGHHAVTEYDENNNVLTGGQVSVTGTLPDLAVTDISGPSSASRGDTVSVTIGVSNLVSVAAGGFRVGIYLSSDTSVTTGDTLIGSYTVASLAGFTTDTRTTSVTIPSNLSPGNYYLGVIADDQGAVTEANESNNTELLRTGTSTSTRLTSASDFIAGLAGSSNVAVLKVGSNARVLLSHSIVWTTNSGWDTPSVGSRAKPAIADLNGDGLPDLLIGSSSGTVYGYQNTGTVTSPVWTANSGWNIPANGASISYPAIVDLDGDGRLDVIVGYRDYMRVYRNTGSNTSPVWTENTSWEITGLTANGLYAPTAGDLDGDGKIDLLMGKSNGTILAYRNSGTASTPAWSAASGWGLPSLTGAISPRLADLDGNGTLDLMIGDPSGVIHGYSNTGTTSAPAWTAHTAWDVPDHDGTSNQAGPALGDLNGDGSLDLLYGDLSGVAYGYQNTGTFSATGTYVSKVADAGTHNGYTTLDYVSSIPSGTTLTVDVRSGDTTTAGDGTWTPWINDVANGGDISALGTKRYVQYELHFTSDGTQTLSPSVFAIQALTSEAPPQPTVVSVVEGGSGGGGTVALWELLALAGLGVAARGSRRRSVRH